MVSTPLAFARQDTSCCRAAQLSANATDAPLHEIVEIISVEGMLSRQA
jgi:hypothetical protein